MKENGLPWRRALRALVDVVTGAGAVALLCLVALALIPLGDLRLRARYAVRTPRGVHFPGGTQALAFDLVGVLVLTLLAAAVAAGLVALRGRPAAGPDGPRSRSLRRAWRTGGLTMALGVLAALGYAFLGG